MDEKAADVLLQDGFAAELGAEHGPEVIVLAHPVVEPADVDRVLDGVAGEAERDDLVDGAVQPVEPDVGEAGRGVGPQLAPEAVLGGQDEVGIVAFPAEGPDEIPGDDDVPALDERHVRRDDEDAFSFQRGRLISGYRRLS